VRVLLPLQEVEDLIRDAAEDHGSTSLTPAMLAACLHKAHKQLDESAVSEYVARAFGPGWLSQQHKLAQPLGAVIKAVRCGGVPNAVRPAAGLNSIAGAVSRIVPVGKFKNKLVSALKVGFSKDGGTAAAAAGTRLKSRRAGQEAVSAAIAAVLSGDGSKPKPKQAAQTEYEALSNNPVLAAADTASSMPAAAATGSGAAAALGQMEEGVPPGHHDASTLAVTQQQQGPQAGISGSKSNSFNAANGRSSGFKAGGAGVLMPPDEQAATAADGTPRPAAAQAVRPSAAGGAARSSAIARALTVDVLSAMEAVRQSWLKEEEDKLLTLSGSGAAKQSRVAAPAATPAAQLGLAQPVSPSAGFFADSVEQQGRSLPGQELLPGAVGSSFASSSGNSRHYSVPAVPTLRLEVLHADSALYADSMTAKASAGSSSRTAGSSSLGASVRSSMGSSVPASGRGSSRDGASAPSGVASEATVLAPNSSRSLQQQRSVKSILLSHQDTHKPAKHVHISMEDTVFAFQPRSHAGDSTNAAASGPEQHGDGQQQQQQQLTAGIFQSPKGVGRQLSEVWEGQALHEAEPAIAGDTADASGQDSSRLTGSNSSSAAAVSTGAAGTVSRSNSGSSRARAQFVRLPSDLKPAGQSPRQPGKHQQVEESSGPSGSSTTTGNKRRGGKSSKHAALLPQLLLTDADDACAAALATPGGADADTEVCFTPQAPEEGGKRNAFLMRRLNKGKSLKQLEEVMLAVAEGEVALDPLE